MKIQSIQINAVQEKLFDLCDYLVATANTFNYFDWMILKLTLVSFGIGIGSLCANFFKKWRVLVLITCLVGYAYMIWRIFSPLWNQMED